MKRVIRLGGMVVVMLSLMLCQPVFAAELQKDFSVQKAVVFTLDASNSMNGNDRNRLAIDSIAQLIYSLPSNYSVGLWIT